MTPAEAAAELGFLTEYAALMTKGLVHLPEEDARKAVELFEQRSALLRERIKPASQLLIVHHDHDTPENRAAAEKALHERGVTEVRHQVALNITDDRVMLRSDGYARAPTSSRAAL